LKDVGGYYFLICMTRNYAENFYKKYHEQLERLNGAMFDPNEPLKNYVPACFKMYHEGSVSNFTTQFFLQKD
jgi:hypothetical protein